jgi:hypothetical protein
MRVLVACERSGIVRNAFLALGHDAHSVDLEEAEDGSIRHYKNDAIKIATAAWLHWDLMIAHPPCTYLASSGLHWNGRIQGRAEKTEEALMFAEKLWNLPIKMIALENPVGCLSRKIGRATQCIQPYQFGEDASKRTCLWLKGLPPLRPTSFIEPRYINGRPRWANQTDSGQNRLAPSMTRATDRARTYTGIAQAMAKQWTVEKDRRDG